MGPRTRWAAALFPDWPPAYRLPGTVGMTYPPGWWDPPSMDQASILLQTPIFRDLSVPEVEELLPEMRQRSCARGQLLWVEGDPADVLVVVAEGQLKAHRVSRDGREVILAVYTAVAITGEVGLFHPAGIRWLSLSAMTPARCLTVRRAPLLGFLAGHPAAMQRMLEQLSTAAVQAAYSFSGVAFADIGRRLAGLLLDLSHEYGETTPDGLRLRPRLSQTELAAWIAASRENVNRALAALVSRGIVSQNDGHIYVRDLPALVQAARPDTEVEPHGL